MPPQHSKVTMNQETLAGIYQHEKLSFLAPSYDTALIGVTKRANTPALPVYSYPMGVLHTPGGAVEVFRHMGGMLTTPMRPSPLVVFDVNKEHFWDSVRRKSLAAWENLSGAIIGEGRRSGYKESAVVYDYAKAINILARSMHSSVDSEAPYIAAIEFYEQKIAPVWFGEVTPFFVRLHVDEK